MELSYFTTVKDRRRKAVIHERCTSARFSKCLSLNGLMLRRIPSDILALGSIQHLYLHNTKLVGDFPLELMKLPCLTTLDLSQNAITVLPDAFCLSAKMLKVLDLSYNQLSRLPGSVIHLETLIELNVAHNKIIYVPSELGHLSRLQELLLNNNAILGISSALFEGKASYSLKVLDLHSNQIDEIPSSVGLLEALVFLDVSTNRLKYLPVEARNLMRLETILYGSNPWIERQSIKGSSAHGTHALSVVYQLTF